MTPKDPERTRERLIEATLLTLQTEGTSKLSLESIARQAGVSKGGLLHHYPSKDALIQAIVQSLLDAFEHSVTHYAAQEPERPGRWLRAYIHASFENSSQQAEQGAVLLALIAENRTLLPFVQDDLQRWHLRLIQDGVPIVRATIIRQAADATWIEALLGTPVDMDMHQKIYEELLRMTEVTP